MWMQQLSRLRQRGLKRGLQNSIRCNHHDRKHEAHLEDVLKKYHDEMYGGDRGLALMEAAGPSLVDNPRWHFWNASFTILTSILSVQLVIYFLEKTMLPEEKRKEIPWFGQYVVDWFTGPDRWDRAVASAKKAQEERYRKIVDVEEEEVKRERLEERVKLLEATITSLARGQPVNVSTLQTITELHGYSINSGKVTTKEASSSSPSSTSSKPAEQHHQYTKERYGWWGIFSELFSDQEVDNAKLKEWLEDLWYGPYLALIKRQEKAELEKKKAKERAALGSTSTDDDDDEKGVVVTYIVKAIDKVDEVLDDIWDGGIRRVKEIWNDNATRQDRDGGKNDKTERHEESVTTR